MTLDPETAWLVIEPQWDLIVELFASKGWDEPSTIKQIVIDPDAHDSCRHFGWTLDDGLEVALAPQLADMPESTVQAIIAHECGHIVDMRNPGRFWYRYGELVDVNPLPSKGMKKHLKRWQGRSDDEAERVADALAESVLGIKIGYIGSPTCLVQALGVGRSRPTGLK